MKEELLLKENDIEKIINQLSDEIYNDVADINKFAIIGIQTRGVELAQRIRRNVEKISGRELPSGTLDITFHRDDIATRGKLPEIKETKINFDISDMTILLVDDVLCSGRTVKAALETLTTYGRPKIIRLFVLVDRGNRELPIEANYCGFTIKTDIKDKIKVQLKEVDNIDDRVVLITQ